MDRHIEADRLPLAGVVKVPVLGGGAGVQHMALAQAVCAAAVVPVFPPFHLFSTAATSFLVLSDPDPLVRYTDLDPSISSSKNSKKNTDSYCFVTSLTSKKLRKKIIFC